MHQIHLIHMLQLLDNERQPHALGNVRLDLLQSLNQPLQLVLSIFGRGFGLGRSIDEVAVAQLRPQLCQLVARAGIGAAGFTLLLRLFVPFLAGQGRFQRVDDVADFLRLLVVADLIDFAFLVEPLIQRLEIANLALVGADDLYDAVSVRAIMASN